MTGSGEGNRPGVRSRHDVGGSDEHVLADVGKEVAVHGGEHGGGAEIFPGVGAQDAAEHGGDQCGGNALAADVGNGNADVAGVHAEEIIIVAANKFRRRVMSRDLEAGHLRDVNGQKNLLDLAGIAQFRLESLLGTGLLMSLGAAEGKAALLRQGDEHFQRVLGKFSAI